MKKIALLFAAVVVMTAANAQVVVGLQGGYLQQKNTNSADADYSLNADYVGGLRVGYMVTPKLYVGLMGGVMGGNTKRMQVADSAVYPQTGIKYAIEDHFWTSEQSGWHGALQVRYEFLKYGNMHFHVLLQGAYQSLGYTKYKESFYWKSFPNTHEYCEPVAPYADSISTAAWSVSLRPTLTYEFSQHLSAELSLDFLSVGYRSETTKYEGQYVTADGKNLSKGSENSTTFYGGLNTMMETLRWESPMLRLGFNWTF